MVIGGTAESVAMVEGEMDEVSEAEMIQAIRVGHEAIVKLCAFQTEIQKEFGKEKREVEIVAPDATLVAKIKEIVGDRFLTTSKAGLGKKEYSNAIKEIVNEVQEKTGGSLSGTRRRYFRNLSRLAKRCTSYADSSR